MARRAGEGKDSVQDMVKNPPKKDEVIMAPLEVAKQPSKPLLKKATGSPSNKTKGIGWFLELQDRTRDPGGNQSRQQGLDQWQSLANVGVEGQLEIPKDNNGNGEARRTL